MNGKEELMKELLASHSSRPTFDTFDPSDLDDPDLLKTMLVQNSVGMNSPKCVLDCKGCLDLSSILESFTAAINEEQAWALCYQCVKSAQTILNQPSERDLLALVTQTDQIKLNRDGHVHKDTYLQPHQDTSSKGPPRIQSSCECKIISNLALVIYEALDFGMPEEDERQLSPDLTALLDAMSCADESAERPETDDEGIERDSGDSDDDRMGGGETTRTFNFDTLLELCRERLGSASSTSLTSGNANSSSVIAAADAHYKAVCRALVAEALELSMFLEKVAQGTQLLRSSTTSGHTYSGYNRNSPSPSLRASDADLDKLHFTVWARLWVQVIQDLRNGVKLKKPDDCSSSNYRPPIEWELTPYEILMDDIRSRRYKLKQVMVDGELPSRVKKDAHAVILDFIRSRPPLKKVTDRVLGPPPMKTHNPIEALMESIRQQHNLRPTEPFIRTSSRKDSVRSRGRRQSSHEMTTETNSTKKGTSHSNSNNESASVGTVTPSSPSQSMTTTSSHPGQPPQRRLIKADLDALYALEKDDESDEDEYSAKENGSCYYGHICPDHSQSEPVSPWKSKPENGGQHIDLRRRHTICNPSMEDEHGSTQITFPFEYTNTLNIYNSLNGPSVSPILHRRKTKLPHSTSKSALQEEFFQSNQWQTAMECLSLNLEEVVHIRNVLTKAELEALPVDCSTKEDVERGKVCFLCLKSRFSLFGPWGNTCKLCKRMVCAKCCSKMRIPTEHFAKIPVSTLSPLLSPREEDRDFLTLKTPTPGKNSPSPVNLPRGRKNSVGSAPTSPSLSRKSMGTDSDSGQRSISPGLMDSEERDRFSPDSSSGPYSLPSVSSISHGLMAFKRRSFGRGKEDDKTERLRGAPMVVCHDCKAMVLQIIRSSRVKNSHLRNNMTLELPSVHQLA